MGLGIAAYSELCCSLVAFPGDDCYDFCVDENTRVRGTISHGYYVFGNSEPSFSFSAGNYGAYGLWREMLCVASNGVMPRTVWTDTDRYVETPFYQLVDFSDCEGVIVTDACTRLAAEFADNETRLRDAIRRGALVDVLDGVTWNVHVHFWKVYRNFAKAFELATPNGAVHFR